MRRALPGAFLVIIAGCGRCGQPATTSDADVIAVPQDAGTIMDARPDARPRAYMPTPEERKKYNAALKLGRQATVTKSYPAAVAAFDEALLAIPLDARALGERGYARFLSGDDVGAEKDFNAAIDAVPKEDRKLTAQIYFNLGLVAEKRGASAGAFFRSVRAFTHGCRQGEDEGLPRHGRHNVRRDHGPVRRRRSTTSASSSSRWATARSLTATAALTEPRMSRCCCRDLGATSSASTRTLAC
jgi:hypothetical protein